MAKVQVEIEKVMRYIGMDGTKKGFWCFYWCVFLALEDPTLLYHVTKELYPRVGERCGMSKTNVERDIRALIEFCWNYGDREAMRKVAGRHLATKPTTGELVDYVASYLRFQSYE